MQVRFSVAAATGGGHGTNVFFPFWLLVLHPSYFIPVFKMHSRFSYSRNTLSIRMPKKIQKIGNAHLDRGLNNRINLWHQPPTKVHLLSWCLSIKQHNYRLTMKFTCSLTTLFLVAASASAFIAQVSFLSRAAQRVNVLPTTTPTSIHTLVRSADVEFSENALTISQAASTLRGRQSSSGVRVTP
jgi:hypothetical protein